MKIEKNNSEEIKSKSIAKKLSFLLVILGAGVVHFVVKSFKIDSALESSSIFSLWVLVSFILLILLPKETAAQKDFKLSDSDFSGLFYKPSKNRVFLEGGGVTQIAVVDFLTKTAVGGSAPSTYNYVITYSFNLDGICFTNKKRYFEELIQVFPKQGDLIEIKYEKSNPNNSIIVHELADNVKWYQLQKKYKIKIINKANQ